MKTRSTAAAAAVLVAGLASALAGPAPLALAGGQSAPHAADQSAGQAPTQASPADRRDRPVRLPIVLPDVSEESFGDLDKAIQY